jgi:hypothetical protein
MAAAGLPAEADALAALGLTEEALAAMDEEALEKEIAAVQAQLESTGAEAAPNPDAVEDILAFENRVRSRAARGARCPAAPGSLGHAPFRCARRCGRGRLGSGRFAARCRRTGRRCAAHALPMRRVLTQARRRRERRSPCSAKWSCRRRWPACKPS